MQNQTNHCRDGIHLRLRVAAFALLLPLPALSLPPGEIGGPADSLLRVESLALEICSPPGPVCFEALGELPLADYSLDSRSEILASGTVDHSAGELSGTISLAPAPGEFIGDGELIVNARDRFTVAGPAPGETVTITARFRVQGTIKFTGEPSSESAVVEALVSHAPNGWDEVNGGLVVSTGAGDILRTGTNPPYDAVDVDLEAVDTFDVTVGTPFQFAYRMDLYGGTSGGTGERRVDLDFGSTGTLTFELPADHYITSELGYGQRPTLSTTVVGLEHTPVAVCANLSAADYLQVQTPGGVIDCEAEGLQVTSGDRAAMLVLGRTDGSGFSGDSDRLIGAYATCRNFTTQDVAVTPLDSAGVWDCGATGLPLNAADWVSVLLIGETE